jgi:hypothetical protein
MGDRHVLGIAGFLSSFSGQYMRSLIARRSLVALDPHDVYGFTLAAEFADSVSDVPGHGLARSRTGVPGSCDRARRIRVDGHVSEFAGGHQEPFDYSFDGGYFCVEGR